MKTNILVVDDDISIPIALARMLRAHGFDVIVAENGEIALELLKQKPTTEVMISDLQMPGIDGLKTIEEAKKINPAIRTFLMSGKMDPELERLARLAGAEGTFPKPVDASTVVIAIKAK